MYTLFIDESGTNTLKNITNSRPHFSLSSVIVANNKRQELKTRADQIKFKYWGRTDICFHAVDLMGMKKQFGVFRNQRRKLDINDFKEDFLKFLDDIDIKMGVVCVNKLNYLQHNTTAAHALNNLSSNKNFQILLSGTEKNTTIKYADMILLQYLHFLIDKNSTGQIVIEATGSSQDLHFFSAYNRLLSNGCPAHNLSGEEVRERHFTSIAFVTKNNHDIETQLADFMGYFFNIKARYLDGLDTRIQNSFEDKLINILDQKEFQYKVRFDDATTVSSFVKLH